MSDPGFVTISGPEHAKRRRIDHAKGRGTVCDQGNIDSEICAAIDKPLGAVKRINAPVLLRFMISGGIIGFFGDRRNIWGDSSQPVDNNTVCCEISLGDGAAIGLVCPCDAFSRTFIMALPAATVRLSISGMQSVG